MFRTVTALATGLMFCMGNAIAGNLDYRFAAESLEDAKRAEGAILGLHADLRRAAILSAGGTLNLKLQSWGKSEVDQGKLAPQELFAVMASTMRSLAAMTQAASWNDATVCHLKEAAALDDMAAGKTAKPVNCRASVYGATQATALRLGPQLNDPKIADAINQWAASTLLSNYYAVKADKAQ